MYKVSEKTMELYTKNAPEVKKIPRKMLSLAFENGVNIENDRILYDTFELSESICEESNIKFGGCIASCMKIKVANLENDISGTRFLAVQKIEGGEDIKYGTFTVDSAKLTDDMENRELIAYDDIYGKLNTDVSDWYKNLNFPVTLKTFRKSLFSYVGVETEEQDITNDDMIVEKTVSAEYMNGIDVARAIGEISGTFGKIVRGGKFKYVSLSGKGLYPSPDLYPSDDLYPASSDAKFGKSGYITTNYEEYETAPIDCLKIRQEEGDVGSVSYSTRNYKNPYIITGNFLVYGKNSEELQRICDNTFSTISGILYRPHTTKSPGQPYLEPGDSFTLEKKNGIESYIFSRVLTGSQVLIDEYSAEGDMYLSNDVSPNMEIQILKSKTLIIQKSVDGLSTKVTDLENNTNSRFEQTANQITLQVSDLDEKLSGQIKLTKESLGSRMDNVELGLNSKIEQTANSIRTEVNNSVSGLNSKIEQTESGIRSDVSDAIRGLSSSFEQTTERISQRVSGLEGDYSSLELYVDRIESTVSDMEGNVSKLEQTVDGFTFSSSGGAVKIHGDTIESGTLKSVSVVFDTHNAVYWVAGGSDIGDTTETEWGCSSDAIFGNYRGERTIQLYRRSGDILAEGTGYFDEIYITGSQSFWQGWSLSDTLEDLYNRVKALGG